MREAVEIAARDGTTLRGELRRAGSDLVVLVHDRGSDLDSWRSLAGALAEDGLAVLAYDLRGHGGSEGEPDPARDEDDLQAVVDFGLATGAARLFLGAEGTSSRAALAVAERSQVAALFVLDAVGDPDSLRSAPSVPKLVLLPAGGELESEAPGIFAGRSFVVSLPVQGPLLETAWSGNVRAHILRFLREARLSSTIGATG